MWYTQSKIEGGVVALLEFALHKPWEPNGRSRNLNVNGYNRWAEHVLSCCCWGFPENYVTEQLCCLLSQLNDTYRAIADVIFTSFEKLWEYIVAIRSYHHIPDRYTHLLETRMKVIWTLFKHFKEQKWRTSKREGFTKIQINIALHRLSVGSIRLLGLLHHKWQILVKPLS